MTPKKNYLNGIAYLLAAAEILLLPSCGIIKINKLEKIINMPPTIINMPPAIISIAKDPIEQEKSEEEITELIIKKAEEKKIEEEKLYEEELVNAIIEKESNGNPYAKNTRTGAAGLGGILPDGALADWNQLNQNFQYTKKDLLNPEINLKLTRWYINKRIPQLLNWHGLGDNPKNRVMAYNWGANNVRKWEKEGADYNRLPSETKDYLQFMEARGLLE